MYELINRICGLVFIFGGILCLLVVYRIYPRKVKDPEKMELWHRKFDKIMKIICPIMIIGGILYLLGVLD